MIPVIEIKQESPASCLFLADAHLIDEEDARYRNLLQFLSQISGRETGRWRSGTEDDLAAPGTEMIVDHLFILGDFFDFWFSRQERIYPGFRAIIDSLVHLKEKGVTIHLCEGNHDFFMQEYFSRTLGMNVYKDWAALNCEGKRILIGHGDMVDRTNHKYLFLRKILRSRPFFFLQRILPLSMLWFMARKSSLASQELMGGAQDVIRDKMSAFARENFEKGYDAIILGHCHKPQYQEFGTGGDAKAFITLGDWIAHFTYLIYDNHGFRLLCYQERKDKGI